MKENLLTVVVGAAGAGASEVASTVASTSPEVLQVVIQILIGVATLWKLLRKKEQTPAEK